MEATFWLAENYTILEPENWHANASNARHTALSSHHVEQFARTPQSASSGETPTQLTFAIEQTRHKPNQKRQKR